MLEARRFTRKHDEKALMNAVIERIRASGYVEDAEGKTYQAKASAVSFEAGALLYDFIRAARPVRTLEVGMAYGISTLFICQAHRDNGSGTHTAIDPFEESVFKSIGLLNLERAKLRDLVQFHPVPSGEVLPQLCTRNERYDFAFIDGNHRFDYVLVDFFYVDRLLEVGGHVAFDDIWMPGVRKAASFVSTNKPYRLVRAPTTARTPTSTRLFRLGRRILQNPFGRDWAL